MRFIFKCLGTLLVALNFLFIFTNCCLQTLPLLLRYRTMVRTILKEGRHWVVIPDRFCCIINKVSECIWHHGFVALASEFKVANVTEFFEEARSRTETILYHFWRNSLDELVGQVLSKLFCFFRLCWFFGNNLDELFELSSLNYGVPSSVHSVEVGD